MEHKLIIKPKGKSRIAEIQAKVAEALGFKLYRPKPPVQVSDSGEDQSKG